MPRIFPKPKNKSCVNSMKHPYNKNGASKIEIAKNGNSLPLMSQADFREFLNNRE